MYLKFDANISLISRVRNCESCEFERLEIKRRRWGVKVEDVIVGNQKSKSTVKKRELKIRSRVSKRGRIARVYVKKFTFGLILHLNGIRRF